MPPGTSVVVAVGSGVVVSTLTDEVVVGVVLLVDEPLPLSPHPTAKASTAALPTNAIVVLDPKAMRPSLSSRG